MAHKEVSFHFENCIMTCEEISSVEQKERHKNLIVLLHHLSAFARQAWQELFVN